MASLSRTLWTAVGVFLVLVLSVTNLSANHRHNQLVLASAKAQERILYLERKLLQAERDAHKAHEPCAPCAPAALTGVTIEGASQRSIPPPPSPAPASDASVSLDAVREAARAEMRATLLQASAAGPQALSETTASSTPAELTAWARFALDEALAADEPGWCRCPPPPNVTQLCRTVFGPPASGWEVEAGRARAEADALREAVLAANAHVQEMHERLVEARALLEGQRSAVK